MDNRIANDMISSGMIPSGEKKKEDLSRTQYGSAPSPSKLMDAYKSMYDKKEEVINEMSGKGMGMTPAPKPQGMTPAKRVEKSNLPAKRVEKSNLPKPQDPATSKPQKDFIKARMSDSPAPKTETKPETKSMVDTVRDRRKEVVSSRREKVQGIMNKYGESVDLLAAYRAVYEHHKKDADGNTIPHESEEIDEAAPLAALAPLLTKVAAIGKGVAATAGKAAVKGAIKVGGKTGGAMMKSVVRNPMQTLQKVDMVGRMIPKPSGLPGAQKKNQGNTVSAGSYQAASADLFDIVKGQLLDEGLSEEEIRDIMLTLTPDEILSEVTAEFVLDASKRASAKSTILGSQGDKQGMMDKGAQAKRLYDASAKKRREGNVRQRASAQGPSRIPTGEA